MDTQNLPAIKSQYKDIEAFQNWLNKTPAKSEIKTNPYAGNSQYIPIGIIEQRLDEMYAGLWCIDECHLQVIANSVVCALTLKVFHPVAKIWINRSGIGAIPIQLNKGESEMSFSTIKSDAIRKNAPAAKSQAIRNAAQSLGSVFGRNLNRDDVGDFTPLTDQAETYEVATIEALNLLESSTLTDAVKSMLIRDIPKASGKKLTDIINYLKNNQQ